MRETYDIGVAIHGQAPDIVFELWECNFARPAMAIRTITVAGNYQTVCSVVRVTHYIPPVWRYGEVGDGYEIVRCDPLKPGEYRITVRGDERGRAEFDVAEDGTVTITKRLTCDSMPAEWKQESGE